MKTVLRCIGFATALFLCRGMIPEEPRNTDITWQSENIKVLKYTLILHVDQDVFNYYAAMLRIKCIKKTDVIFLSSKQLEINDKLQHLAIETISSNTHVEISQKQELDVNSELYPVTFNKYLEEGGTYLLRLEFNKSAAHVFSKVIMRHIYFRENRVKTLTVTKSGAASAKELFFCFDDINMKAEFVVLIMHKEGLKSFSNMPSKTYSLAGKWAQDEFEESDLMSTFSFGFVIGEFKSKEYKDNSSPTVIRVSSDESVSEQMNFAGEMALEIFLFYTKHFKITFAVKKLDIVALPDYDRIEKEYYGFISIGESFILYPNTLAGVSKTSIVLCLCDAIVHQFIGLQTTTFQLNEYWLSKGLTLFFQANCIDEIYPEEGIKFWNSYVIKSFTRVLDVSAETSSRPMLVSEKRLQLDTLFSDTFLAERGYHLIRMMNFVVGNTFQDKFIAFFNTHQLVSTNLEEMWKIFDPERHENSQSSNAKTIKEIMNPWIIKNGFPMVTVRRIGKKIVLRQERFVLLGDTYTNHDKNKHWVFPFSYTTTSEKNFKNVKINYWLQSKESNFKPETAIKKSDWIIYNGNLNVLCRINYEQKNWELLQATLLEKNQYFWISPEARARLILDMFALAENGNLKDSYKLPLKTIKYLQHEDSHVAWIAAMHEVNKIYLKLRNTAELIVYKEYVKGILAPVFEKDTFKTITQIPEDADEKNLKKLIITSACTAGVTSCVQQCRTLFNEWMKNVKNGENNNPIPLAIRDVVSCQAIKHGGKDEWNFLWDQKVKEKDILTAREVYKALGCTNNLDRLEDYMDYWVDKDKILPTDFEAVFNSFLLSETGYLRMKRVFIERLRNIIINLMDRYRQSARVGSSKKSVIMTVKSRAFLSSRFMITQDYSFVGYFYSLQIANSHNYQHEFEIISYFVKILEVTNNRFDMADLVAEAESQVDHHANNFTKIKRTLDEGSKKTKRNIMWLEKHRRTFSKIAFQF